MDSQYHDENQSPDMAYNEEPVQFEDDVYNENVYATEDSSGFNDEFASPETMDTTSNETDHLAASPADTIDPERAFVQNDDTPRDVYEDYDQPMDPQDLSSAVAPPMTSLKRKVSIEEPNKPLSDVNARSKSAQSVLSEISSQPSEINAKNDDRRAAGLASMKKYSSQYTVGGRLKTKHLIIRLTKCCGMTFFIILSMFVITYYLVFGFSDEVTELEDESQRPLYDIQQVLPGRLEALSLSGDIAAIKNDFDSVQVYRHNNATEAPFWERMGQPFTARGLISLSGNGTIAAFVDKASRRPQIVSYDYDKDLWIEMSAPLIICDELKMDADASVLAIGAYNRLEIGAWRDFIVTYSFDGSRWNEFANRLQLGSIDTFELSPTGEFIVVATPLETGQDSSAINTFMLSDQVDPPVWEQLDYEERIDGRTPSIAVAEDLFALAHAEVINVFSYSGRTWGQGLVARENSTFASVALSLDGRTLVAGDIGVDNSGIVVRYTFPWTADTGDDWEVNGPPLEYDWQIDEEDLRDEYGREAPVFGESIQLDGAGLTIAIQSGVEGNQNVHFYDVVPPLDDDELEETS